MDMTDDAGRTPVGLPRRPPADCGCDAERLRHAMALLERGRDEGVYPGAVGLVARRGAVVASRAVGVAEQGQAARPMALDTIFDLASVTKVVAGVTAVLVLLDAGIVCLDDAVARFMPQFGGNGKRPITIRHLLTHTSGLPPWLPCYTVARSPEEVFSYISGLELDAAPGTQVQYSDLGMALIRMVVDRVAGEDMSTLLDRTLFGPLGMGETSYSPPAAKRGRIAATEQGNRFEQAMVARAGLRFDHWRERLLVGEVNDGNTHYALGGVSTHAGLFSTAGDLARFGQLYLQQGVWQGRSLLSRAALAEATRLQTGGLNDAYGLGWRLNRRCAPPSKKPVRSALTRAIFPDDPLALPALPWCGDILSPRTFGHTGFTGVSLTIDPEHDLLLILLTSRIHPDAGRGGLERFRARWHNAVAAAILV